MLVEPYVHKNIHLQCTPQNMCKSSHQQCQHRQHCYHSCLDQLCTHQYLVERATRLTTYQGKYILCRSRNSLKNCTNCSHKHFHTSAILHTSTVGAVFCDLIAWQKAAAEETSLCVVAHLCTSTILHQTLINIFTWKYPTEKKYSKFIQTIQQHK